MKVFLIRHGDTDWKQVEMRGVRGWARSFAPLTALGRLQIDTIASDYRLQEVEAILCSSYARALESGARLSRSLNKPLYVEYDLHEWLPQKNPLGDVSEDVIAKANRELSYYTGYYPFPERRVGRDPHNKPTTERRVAVHERRIPSPELRSWESLEEVRERVLKVFERYNHFSKLAVITHAVVMTSLIGVKRPIEHAEIVPFDFDSAALPQAAVVEKKVS